MLFPRSMFGIGLLEGLADIEAKIEAVSGKQSVVNNTKDLPSPHRQAITGALINHLSAIYPTKD